MYTHCLFCNRHLGRNDALEAFPVGGRLAFDAAQGRLWVVCPACARWNLTPLEARWEAIEQAERLFRATRLRASTDNVGLARAKDGTDLVRVGRALRPEFAAWRYGRQLVRRQARYYAKLAVNTPVALGVGLGGVVLPFCALGYVSAGSGLVGVLSSLVLGRAVYDVVGDRVTRGVERALRLNTDRVIAWLPAGGTEERLPVTFAQLAHTRVGRAADGGLRVDVAHAFGRHTYAGPDADRVLSALMPHVNQAGARPRDVRAAVGAIEARDGPERYLRGLALTTERASRRARDAAAYTPGLLGVAPPRPGGLFALSDVQRLALEMALREDVERRAMDGELATLERAWREAEEIAAIADALTVPDRVERAFARLRDGRADGPAG